MEYFSAGLINLESYLRRVVLVASVASNFSFLAAKDASAESNISGLVGAECGYILQLMKSDFGKRVSRSVVTSFFSGLNMASIIESQKYIDLERFNSEEAIDGLILSGCAKQRNSLFVKVLMDEFYAMQHKEWRQK